MTVLSAQSIRRLSSPYGHRYMSYVFVPEINEHCVRPYYDTPFPMIHPFVEKTVFEGKSYGLTCAGYDIRIAQNISIHPGEFLLASSVEYFRIPKNVRGTLWNKSSWAREGLDQSQTILEPGWEGYLTLELKNLFAPSRFKGEEYEKRILRIKKGSPIAQISFEWLDEETDTPYVGKYQNQPNKPVNAIYEH